MNLAAAFYISVYGLAAIAGGTLAWAEETVSVTALTPLVAVATLFLNERYRLLRLDGWSISIVGILAFVYPAAELTSGNEESRLLAGAHLLALLQWVLMVYNKSAHQYWWMCALSGLQIAVASVLTSSIYFGLLILIYMFWALWTLSLFTLLLSRLRYHDGSTDGASPASPWQWPAIPENERFGRTTATGGQFRSEIRSSIQSDPHVSDVNARFVIGVCGMSLSALALGFIFFLLTPRMWIGGNPFSDTALAGITVGATGFNEKVNLGDFGKILESSAPVLELQLFDDKSGKPIHLHQFLSNHGQEEAYLRGSVTGTYRNGTWEPNGRASTFSFGGSAPFFSDPTIPYVRQTVRLEPSASRLLFSLVDPVFGRIEDLPQVGIRMAPDTRMLSVGSAGRPIISSLVYHLFLPPSARRRPTVNPNLLSQNRPLIRERYLDVPDELVYLKELAQQIVDETTVQNPVEEGSQQQVVDAILRHLRDSGVYRYSLDTSVFDPVVDPVEDFLKNRKQGHCQYFATALALMLRVAGIPTRVITGFKGGLEKPEEGYLEVQQRHAHAWVEAYVNDEWTIVDATPAMEREESVKSMDEDLWWWQRLSNSATTFWQDYVVNMTFSRQQKSLYAPFQALYQMAMGQFEGTSDFLGSIARTLNELRANPEMWFSWRGGLTAFFLMLFFTGTFYGFRLLRKWIQGRLNHSRDHARHAFRVDFFEKFLTLVRPYGLVMAHSETQQEFSRQVADYCLQRGASAPIQEFAIRIAEKFYRMRFGSQILSHEEIQQLNSELREFDTHLRAF